VILLTRRSARAVAGYGWDVSQWPYCGQYTLAAMSTNCVAVSSDGICSATITALDDGRAEPPNRRIRVKFAAFIQQFDRRAKMESRGSTIVTASASLLTVIFGLTVLVTGKNYAFGKLLHSARMLVLVGKAKRQGRTVLLLEVVLGVVPPPMSCCTRRCTLPYSPPVSTPSTTANSGAIRSSGLPRSWDYRRSRRPR
jgi:hypothetical protein